MGSPPSSPPPVAIIASRYNPGVTAGLLDGAIGEYERRGGDRAALAVVEAPGAFELPQIGAVAAATGRYRAIVCLGCVIKGQTPHDEHIARAIAHGLTDLSRQTGMPVAFGVITALDAGQALARAGGARGNKGVEAMSAALDALAAMDALREHDRSGFEHRLPGPATDKTGRDEGDA